MNNQFEASIRDSVAKCLNYEIKNINYFKDAFTHKSTSSLHNYERLEILGDAVLQLYITEILFIKYPNYSEGDITVMRQNLVNSENLDEIFISLGLKNISDKINKQLKGSNVYSDIFESIMGALYLDCDSSTVKSIIYKIFKPLISKKLLKKDSKSQLQEYLHSKKISLPNYVTTKSKKKSFKYLVSCIIPSINVNEKMYSNKVKSTEQILAKKVLNKINEKN